MILKNNFGTGKIGYLGKEGNNGLEDFGYAMGGLANVQDLFAGFNGENVDYKAMKDPTGHGSLVNGDRTIDISKGLAAGETSISKNSNLLWGRSAPHTTYDNSFSLTLSNVSGKILKWMTKNIKNGKDISGLFKSNYSLLGNTCTSQVARALWGSGVWGVNPFTIHPISLYIQLAVREQLIMNSYQFQQR